jgi:hypothetical protein
VVFSYTKEEKEMKFNIDDYKGKYVMHCKTEEEARSFCTYMSLVGRQLGCSLWCYCGNNVIFFNNGTWGSREFAEKDGYKILEWSDFMNKEFTKADLKTGDVVKFRNEELGIVITDIGVIACKNGGWVNLDGINNDLTSSFRAEPYDIIAVRRPYDKPACSFDAFRHNAPRGTLVYERKEVEEMTLAEVCRLLGKEIKIVK